MKIVNKKKESLLPREQVISTVLGMVVVIIVGTLVYRYFQKGEGLETPTPTEKTTETAAGFVTPTDLPATYKVQANDSLWKIAEMHYGSGYNWTDIAKENDLTSADLLVVGQELNIPDVEAKIATIEKIAAESPISPGQYTVQKGDWLSKVALRAYGDVFAWEKIYEANKELIGPNPNMIEVGQVLTIPN